MNASDYILKEIAAAGVRHAFLVYGGAIAHLVDAFSRQDEVQPVVMQHEQAAGFAAEGYAKATRGLGVALATSGPGGGNLVTAIQNCYYDSTPVLFITGQVSSRLRRGTPHLRQRGFQETPIVDIVRPITKGAVQVKQAEDLALVLRDAIQVAAQGRPGPTLVDICSDVQTQDVDVHPRWAIPGHATGDFPEASTMVGHFMGDLRRAERPALLIGGGCRRCPDVVRALVERLGVPAFATWNALDLVTSDTRNYRGRVGTYGGEGRNLGIQNCDLLLAIGCRFSGRITGGKPDSFARGAKKYVVDVDPHVIDEAALQKVLYEGESLRCDAEYFMRRLLMAQTDFPPPRKDWLEKTLNWRLRYDPVRPEHFDGRRVHHYGFLRALSSRVPSNAIVVADTGGSAIMTAHAFETKRGQTFFSSNGNSPMGFALAAGIGAAFVHPERPVYCIIGDGGLQLNIQELQTIGHYNLPIKIVLLNNRILGNTKAYQVQNLEGRAIACDAKGGYSTPDFQRVVEAYRIDTALLRDRSLEQDLLDYTVKHAGPCFLEVLHEDFCDYRPRMTLWNAGVEEMYPPIDLAKEMIVPPLPGWEDRAKTYKEMK